MAKKPPADGANKSQAIRDLLKDQPRTKTSDVIAKLAGAGVEVSSQLVSNVRARMKGKRRKAKTKDRAEVAAKKPQTSFSLESLLEARKFIDSIGSLDKARATLDALGKLKG